MNADDTSGNVNQKIQSGMGRGWRRYVMVSIIVTGIVYVALYLHFRSAHRIVHFSNSRHYCEEHRSPGHSVNVIDNNDRVTKIAFFPLMVLEEIGHTVLDAVTDGSNSEGYNE